jgi:hypothetical protein
MKTGRSKDLGRREKELGRKHPDLEFKPDKRTDAYEEQRGREQIIHDEYDPPLDKINPISPTNPKREEYIKAGSKL